MAAESVLSAETGSGSSVKGKKAREAAPGVHEIEPNDEVDSIACSQPYGDVGEVEAVLGRREKMPIILFGSRPGYRPGQR